MIKFAHTIDVDRAVTDAVTLQPVQLERIQRELSTYDRERPRDRKTQTELRKTYAGLLHDLPTFPRLRPADPRYWVVAVFRWAKWKIQIKWVKYRLVDFRETLFGNEPPRITQMRLIRQFYHANRAVAFEEEFDRWLNLDMYLLAALKGSNVAKYERQMLKFRMAAHEAELVQLRVV